jgi:predicted nucleic acid-binding protein
MALEAIGHFSWPNTGIANRLRRHPTEVQQLTRFHQAIAEIPFFGIQVHPITFSLLSTALDLCQAHGLLTNDALIAAFMQANSWSNLASEDDDFDRVPGIIRYAPV